MKRAWLLARVSTTKREQDESPERQLEALRGYCSRVGWSVVGEGAERRSGGSLDRPELNRALAAIRAGACDVLAVVDLDRLGRNLSEMLACVDELHRLGSGLVVMRMGRDTFVDTTSATGRFLFSMLAAVAEFTRGIYRERSIEGQRRAREAGRHVGRPAEFLPAHAASLALSFRAEGETWRRVSAVLAQHGYLQPSRMRRDGGVRERRPWPPGTLARLVELSRRGSESEGVKPASGAEE